MSGPRGTIDELASALEAAGFPHTLARVFAALVLAESDGLSTGELVERLGVSKASITSAMQVLIPSDLVERYRIAGSRQAHYRVRDRWWVPLMRRRFAGIAVVRRVAAAALSDPPSPLARARLEEIRDVYARLEAELARVLELWDARSEEM